MPLVVLSDTVDEEFARSLWRQARDTHVTYHWSQLITRTALRMIRFRLYDFQYRTIVHQRDIDTWPLRNDNTEPTLLQIAEVVLKMFDSKYSRGLKSIEEQCREYPFEYCIDAESIEDGFLDGYYALVDDYYYLETIDPKMDALLGEILYQKLPRNTVLMRKFELQTQADLLLGPETVNKACYRMKRVLAEFRHAVMTAREFGPFVYTFIHNCDEDSDEY